MAHFEDLGKVELEKINPYTLSGFAPGEFSFKHYSDLEFSDLVCTIFFGISNSSPTKNDPRLSEVMI